MTAETIEGRLWIETVVSLTGGHVKVTADVPDLAAISDEDREFVLSLLGPVVARAAARSPKGASNGD